jgi:crotonobetainyl-CoA:carnitine CoA-transferase CaiB-like acyl-CoA transferase
MTRAPLEGIKVVEMGRVMAAPFCAQMLGDMGADVIKVEMPPRGDESRSYGPHNFGGLSYYFVSLNRNKRSLTLDLKDQKDKEVMRKLLGRSDVFIHNSLPRAISGLGFAYEQVKQLNERLIYCSISGYGAKGPDKDTPALDMIAQAASGVMSITGPPDGSPFRAGVPIADLTAGMFAAFAIMGALRQRDATGKGQEVHTSLLEASSSLLTYLASQYFVTGKSPQRLGNAHPSIVPYDAYPTSDGWVTIAVVNQGIWQRFCEKLGLGEIEHDERFATVESRAANREALTELLVDRFRDMSTVELVTAMKEASVPCEAVRTLDMVFNDANSKAIGLTATFEHPEAGPMSAVNTPFHLSQWLQTIRRPPPKLGEHNDEILGELEILTD